MTNTLVLNHADSAIEALESQLAALDELAADAVTARQTVETVTAEIKVVHDNPNGIEMKVRSNRLRDLTATLELHKSDAIHLQAAVETQKRRVVEVGGVARQAVQGIWSIAHLQRRSNAVAMTRAAFDLTRCPITAETLALCERSYLASKDLEWYFVTLSRSIDDQLAALRELPGRFVSVRQMAEDTPDLILDLAAAEELVVLSPNLNRQRCLGH
jgi:hypothetical protein